jgi:hypothetical protein
LISGTCGQVRRVDTMELNCRKKSDCLCERDDSNERSGQRRNDATRTAEIEENRDGNGGLPRARGFLKSGALHAITFFPGYDAQAIDVDRDRRVLADAGIEIALAPIPLWKMKVQGFEMMGIPIPVPAFSPVRWPSRYSPRQPSSQRDSWLHPPGPEGRREFDVTTLEFPFGGGKPSRKVIGGRQHRQDSRNSGRS